MPEPTPLSVVIAAYLRAVDAGKQPDRGRLLAQFPHLSQELAEFFAAQDQVVKMAQPLRAVQQAGPSPSAALTTDHLGKVGGAPDSAVAQSTIDSPRPGGADTVRAGRLPAAVGGRFGDSWGLPPSRAGQGRLSISAVCTSANWRNIC